MPEKLTRSLVFHPVLWVLAGCALFWAWGGLLPAIRWNAIEMMMAKNLLRGNGLVVTPLDPPALWRPLLGVFLCAAVELFTTDPYTIYRLVYTVSLTVFLIASFYAARALWGAMAGHLACLLIVTNGALTARLVSHIHSLSHVAVLLALGPALFCTALALRGRTPFRLLAAGVCWGAVYLARWESVLMFAVTAVVLFCAAYAETRSLRECARCSFAVIGFAALFVPAAIHQNWVKARYGIWGPSAITTFYASEAWVNGNDDEDAGFAEAVRKYGSLEANHFSMLQAIARHPGAFLDRVRINVPAWGQLFADRQFFDPVWLLLLAGLACDLAWTRKHLLELTWLLLLFLCFTTVCVFAVDTRYLTIGFPSLLLLLSGGGACFLNRVSGRGRARVAVIVTCFLLLGARSGQASYRQFVTAEQDPSRGDAVRTLEFLRGLAAHFQRVTHPSRPAALMMNLKTDMLLLSYYADTAICWKQPGAYPRDKIFSWKPKDPDYLYVPEESLYKTDLLMRSRPIGRYAPHDAEPYYLFPTPWRPFDTREDSGRERLELGFTAVWKLWTDHEPVDRGGMREILARDYPLLLPRFLDWDALSHTTATLELQNNRHADKVGCGVLAGPDNHADRVFKLTVTAGEPAEIGDIELERQAPLGVFRASSHDYLLGVALQDDGPLVNGPDGAVKIPVRESQTLWLYVCDDGANRPGTTYWCRLRIGKNRISTDPIHLR